MESLFSLLGRPGIYASWPGSGFTAAYASATTLTLGGAGIPTITDSVQILGVIEFEASKARWHEKRSRQHVTSYAAPTLTMAGAGFGATSDFVVIVASDIDIAVHLSAALSYTSSSVTTYETPGTAVVSGSSAISNAAATQLNGGGAQPCIGVIVQSRQGNSPIAIGDNGIAGVNEGHVLQGGASISIDTDDVSNLYAYATVLNEQLDWLAIVR